MSVCVNGAHRADEGKKTAANFAKPLQKTPFR